MARYTGVCELNTHLDVAGTDPALQSSALTQSFTTAANLLKARCLRKLQTNLPEPSRTPGQAEMHFGVSLLQAAALDAVLSSHFPSHSVPLSLSLLSLSLYLSLSHTLPLTLSLYPSSCPLPRDVPTGTIFFAPVSSTGIHSLSIFIITHKQVCIMQTFWNLYLLVNFCRAYYDFAGGGWGQKEPPIILHSVWAPRGRNNQQTETTSRQAQLQQGFARNQLKHRNNMKGEQSH